MHTVCFGNSSSCHIKSLPCAWWGTHSPALVQRATSSTSIPQLCSAHPDQLPEILNQNLSLSTQIYKTNIYLKCLGHWVFWGFSVKISLALKTRLGHGNTKLLVSLTVDEKKTTLLFCRGKPAGAKDKESSCCFLKHWFEPALHLKQNRKTINPKKESAKNPQDIKLTEFYSKSKLLTLKSSCWNILGGLFSSRGCQSHQG